MQLNDLQAKDPLVEQAPSLLLQIMFEMRN